MHNLRPAYCLGRSSGVTGSSSCIKNGTTASTGDRVLGKELGMMPFLKVE